MRLPGSVGTAAIVALALGLPAPAGAAGPVWAYCAKASPKDTGAFSDKTCATAAAGHEGKYELVDGIGKGKPFKGSAGSPFGGITIHGVVPPGEFNMYCNSGRITGRPVAPNRVAGLVISLSKCHTNISPEVKTCVFVSAPLSGELGWIDQAKDEAGLKLTSEAEPESGLMAEAAGCLAEVKTRWRGSAIGTWGPVGMISREPTLDYVAQQYLGEPPRYDQDSNPPAFEGEEGVHILRSEINSPESGFEWSTAGGNAAALDGTFRIKGEALMVR
ncbi:MAG: hypothetical protein ACLQBB_10140 [Solirubrobacteraceae bacterium]